MIHRLLLFKLIRPSNAISLVVSIVFLQKRYIHGICADSKKQLISRVTHVKKTKSQAS